MDLKLSKDYEDFRQEVRDFCENFKDQMPGPREIGASDPKRQAWQKLLIEHGYTARTIPKEYGGYGAEPDVLKSRIISEAFTETKTLGGLSNQGISMFVPTLLELGTEEQKKRWIKPTLEGKHVWCQGYSEPNSGSDLASLQTKAHVEDGMFVINGQKIWTSGAHESDMMFCLVRTEPDAPKHKGISYLFFETDNPGIDRRLLPNMTGAASFNEVFFTDAKVPMDQIVGERGDGWNVCNATLKHERGMLGDPNAAGTRLKAIIDMMHEETLDGQRLIDNPVYRDRLVQLQAEATAMQYHGLRLLTASIKKENPGLSRLIVKLQGCELNHQIASFAVDLLGELGVLYGQTPLVRNQGSWQFSYMYDLGLIIGGGTAQIQKNIISEHGLGMPREPKVGQPKPAIPA